MIRSRRLPEPVFLLFALALVTLLPTFAQADPTAVCTTAASETFTNRVTIINNCSDAASVTMTTPADPTSEGLWALAGIYCSDGHDTCTGYNPFVASKVGQKYVLTTAIPSGGSQDLCLPDGGASSGNFLFSLGCTGTDSGTGLPTGCKIGYDPTTNLALDTLFELTPGCMTEPCTTNPSNGQPLGPTDYFDVSAVNGFTIPMTLEVDPANPTAWSTTYQCTFASRSLTPDLGSCPYENFSTISKKYDCPYLGTANSGKGAYMGVTDGSNNIIACMPFEYWMHNYGPGNGCSVTGSTPTVLDYYGCTSQNPGTNDAYALECTWPGCGGPQCSLGPDGTIGSYVISQQTNPTKTIYAYTAGNLTNNKGVQYTNYVKMLKEMGQEVYTWMFDDFVGTLSCNVPGASVTLTLCPNGQTKPYDTASQLWVYNSTTNSCNVTTSGGTTYATQYACMAANAKYSCQAESVSKAETGTTSWVYSYFNYCKPLNPATAPAAEMAAGVSLASCQSSTCQATGTLGHPSTGPNSLLLLNGN
jgi:hypothetical protein